ncbi:MAG: O-methyltransferase [Lasallia pustulata]|uniref:O-methyltransferase n=1 Tax=Lasallia pustulata TaxID=136370 RepID=A0A5M8PFP1_9LECA|nr:MAG: O-methyltransferase [Lasallia pustulata]
MAFPTAAKLPEYLHSVGYQNPEDPVASPFAYTFGAPVFEWIKRNPAEQAVFNAYMAARRKGRPSWFDIFPVEDSLGPEWPGGNADAVLLVDVGGNCGHDLIKFKERCPQISGRLILEDLPQVVADLHLKHEGIELMAYDFCTPQPVKGRLVSACLPQQTDLCYLGARFYYFRAIFHDWPDHTCRKILENTIPAMAKGHSKLIISEFVLPNTGAPLLPCLLDIQMMGLQAGRERTEKEWRALLDSVGLAIAKIWTIEPGTESVIEAELKD